MVRIKICGITNLEDALMAVEAGADALGFVFFQGSPRFISPEKAAEIIHCLPPFVQVVGLFVNEELATVNSVADQCALDVVQLHGEEAPDYAGAVNRRVIKAFRIKDASSLDALSNYRVAACLLDAWTPAAHQHIILAGGLIAENVAEAIATVKPYAVDVSSGVESKPGRKDILKLQRFFGAVRDSHEK